jgi:hypothetical protein
MSLFSSTQDDDTAIARLKTELAQQHEMSFGSSTPDAEIARLKAELAQGNDTHKDTRSTLEAQIQLNKNQVNTINDQQHHIRDMVDMHLQEIKQVKTDFRNGVPVNDLALGVRWSTARKR